MLTDEDFLKLQLKLQEARSLRFADLYPDVPFQTEGQLLILNTKSSQDACKLIPEVSFFLREGAIIMGTTSVEIRCCNKFIFAVDLELEATEVLNKAENAMSTATLERKANNRSVEFELNNRTGANVIAWSQVAPRLMATEAELKSELSASRVPIFWAENGEWGIEQSEAILLIQNFYQRKATEEINSLAALDTPEEKPVAAKKTSKPKLPAIKLVGEYKPVTKMLETCRRYLDAIAPENPEAQMQALEEIIAGGTRGKKHIQLALSAYEEGKAPAEAELIAAFVRLRDRLQKEAEKSTATEGQVSHENEAQN
ncbi:hypothetical protein NIES4101_54020 [Calothrix sp. NIES-4101]|nr:hypothetical protein NIES4101_54020 [Calothrix sp. NIES-4101]